MKLNIFLRLFTMLALVTVFGLTPQAEAANRAGAITLSPMVGAHIFDKNEGFKNSGFIGLNLGYNFTKNWGAELVGTSSRVAKDAVGADDFTYFTGRIDLLYHFRPDERLVPYLAAGIGGALLKHNMPGDTYNQDLLADFGGGIKYFLTDRLALRFDARNVIRHEISFDPITHGNNYNNFMFSSGLTFQLGGKVAAPAPALAGPVDSDHDGVIDSLDRCPGTSPQEAVDADGCPLDSDSDGVTNAFDKCPDTPAGAKVDANGCVPVPEVVVIHDTDADGVVDSEDHCPATPAGVKVDKLGCTADSDHDGIFDDSDVCPGTAAGIKVDAQGCPADSDQDGVLDSFDNCPGTAAGKKVDAKGCEVIYAAMVKLNLEITFASNSSVITPEFKPQLQKAADFIKSHPDKNILIEGYTDNTGSAAMNKQLSQKRADTVRWVLSRDYGVDLAILTAKGFGKDNPIADNSTPEGRKANRRVVIRLAE
ncbi:OmpA family protein [Geopsychrobacter electrodiphilus]|uniref:OmpA family protein n=1 Tax=Geopsychrobacter electrodiphilus TaxID=225196 RepID=UPI000363ACB3|nr:OmpA family protein [Geopsychrobacter electrodiphilus]